MATFAVRGRIYAVGRGETTSQNAASASVWGTDAETSEGIAEFLARNGGAGNGGGGRQSAADSGEGDADEVGAV